MISADSQPVRPGRTPFLLPAGLCALIALAYANSFSGVFLFDDIRFVKFFQNTPFPPSLEDISRSGFAARPLIGLTFGLNQALFGSSLFGYHLVNVLLHALAALALFGVLGRTMDLLRASDRTAWSAQAFAWCATAVWALHPIQTQAVTYIVQRCESAMGLFFFLCFYCAIRGWTGRRTLLWHGASLVSLGLGAMSKETMLVLPLAVFLFDWAVRKRSAWATFRSSAFLYVGCLLFITASAAYFRGTIIGYYQNAGPINFLVHGSEQAEAVVYYLKLYFNPSALCFDHAWQSHSRGTALLCLAAFTGLVLAVAWLSYRKTAVGLALALFLLTIAPVTFFVRLDDAVAEHRLYLPSALLAVLTTAALFGLQRRLDLFRSRAPVLVQPLWPHLHLVPVAVLILLLAAGTNARNAEYAAGELAIWKDVLRKRPDNRRANYVVGGLLAHSGRAVEALDFVRKAATLAGPLSSTDFLLAMNLYGELLHNLGHLDEAIRAFQHVLSIKPGSREAQIQLGHALNSAGRYEATVKTVGGYLQSDPESSLLNYELGVAYMRLRQTVLAIRHLTKAVSGTPLVNNYRNNIMSPRDETYYFLAVCYADLGDQGAAATCLDLALRSNPKKQVLNDILSLKKALSAGGGVPAAP